LGWILNRIPAAERAWFRMRDYLERMWLVYGDGLEATIDYLYEYVRMAQRMGHHRVMLIVDYAQRVPIRPSVGYLELNEMQRIGLIMRGLKGIAMSLGVPVLAVAAADAEGLRQQRIHFENLWGPATVQYEPDVALILNRDTLDDETGARAVRAALHRHALHGRGRFGQLGWGHAQAAGRSDYGRRTPGECSGCHSPTWHCPSGSQPSERVAGRQRLHLSCRFWHRQVGAE
jgi:hypothetical protein